MGDSNAAGSSLDGAWAAFVRADWEEARRRFQEAIDSAPSAKALDGLGQSLLWCGDEEGAIETRTRAFAEYRREGDPEAAANIAVYLAAEYRIAGNASLANGWLSRAERLLEECGDCPGQGWLQIELSKRSTTPEGAEGHARQAHVTGEPGVEMGQGTFGGSSGGRHRVSFGSPVNSRSVDHRPPRYIG
jgi:tetratricopeptide (TPR) repeat protein